MKQPNELTDARLIEFALRYTAANLVTETLATLLEAEEDEITLEIDDAISQRYAKLLEDRPPALCYGFGNRDGFEAFASKADRDQYLRDNAEDIDWYDEPFCVDVEDGTLDLWWPDPREYLSEDEED